jgi:hypothetical protein
MVVGNGQEVFFLRPLQLRRLLAASYYNNSVASGTPPVLVFDFIGSDTTGIFPARRCRRRVGIEVEHHNNVVQTLILPIPK